MKDPVSKASRQLLRNHTQGWPLASTYMYMSTHAYTYSLICMHTCTRTHMHAHIHTPATKSCMMVISSCSLFHPFFSLLSLSSLYTLLILKTFQALSHPQCLCTPLGVLLYLEWFFPHSVQRKLLVVKTSTAWSVRQGSSANWPS